MKEGVLFDSFSESCDSKEGSLRGGANLKAALGPRLQACLEEAVAEHAAGAAISCAPATWVVAPALEEPQAGAARGHQPEGGPPAAICAAAAPPHPGHGGFAQSCFPALHWPGADAMTSTSTTSSYAFSTQGAPRMRMLAELLLPSRAPPVRAALSRHAAYLTEGSCCCCVVCRQQLQHRRVPHAMRGQQRRLCGRARARAGPGDAAAALAPGKAQDVQTLFVAKFQQDRPVRRGCSCRVL